MADSVAPTAAVEPDPQPEIQSQAGLPLEPELQPQAELPPQADLPPQQEINPDDPPPPAYDLPSSSLPPSPGPDASDLAVLAAVQTTGLGPPSINYVPPSRPDPAPAPLYDDPISLLHLTPDQMQLYNLPISTAITNRRIPLPVSSVQNNLANLFTTAVRSNNTELVSLLLGSLVLPSFTDYHGVSALGLASKAGHLNMAKLLISHGADVNQAFTQNPTYRKRHALPAPTRTALLLAAEAGHLSLVKFLLSQGADDAFLASDGQLALRLAAENRHTEIVNLLPARRGGGLLRFKRNYATQIAGIKAVLKSLYYFLKFFTWTLPKFLLWYLPKWLFYELPKNAGKSLVRKVKWAYERRGQFPNWCKKRAEDMGRVLKRLPGDVKRVVVATPRVVKTFLVSMGRGISKAAKVAWEWISRSAVKIASAIGRVFALIVAACHTAIMAVVAAVRRIRNVTLADVVAALGRLWGAIVAVPLSVWRAVKKIKDVGWDIMVYLFGVLGMIGYAVVYGLVWTLTCIPRWLGEIGVRIWRVVRAGGREVMVWFNPKYQ